MGDYARNETAYTVLYGGEPHNYTGKFYAYTKTNGRGSTGQRWLEIDEDNLWFYNTKIFGGTEDISISDLDVLAADYVGGYVYIVAADGRFYISKHGEWFDYQRVGCFDHLTQTIRDMAYNYGNNYLYALDDNNTRWRIDPISGQMTKVAVISVLNEANPTEQFKKLTMLAIDDEGNFYTVNSGSGWTAYLFRFTLDQVENGQISKLKPLADKPYGDINFQSVGGSLARDHDADILYMAGTNNDSANGTYSYLLQFDLTTGIASKVTLEAGGYKTSYAARLYNPVRGLYIVPASSVKLSPTSEESVGIVLDRTQVEGLVGVEFPIGTDIYPWNLADKTILWSTEDPAVATVDNEGYVKMVGLGTTTITATTAAAPNLTATCTVTVEQTPEISFSALTYPASGDPVWAEFETSGLQDWTVAGTAGYSYVSGALVTSYGSLSTVWIYLGSLREVSNLASSQYASLLYNQDSGYLLLSHHYHEGEENQI